jgi:hypothetical protein
MLGYVASSMSGSWAPVALCGVLAGCIVFTA